MWQLHRSCSAANEGDNVSSDKQARVGEELVFHQHSISNQPINNG